MNRIAHAFVISLAVLLGCGSNTALAGIESWTVPATDPVAAVGHGVVLDNKGNEVDIAASPDFVIQAQRYYIKSLYLMAGEQQRRLVNSKQQRVMGKKRLTQREQIVGNAALIDWLSDMVKPANAADLAIRNSILQNEMAPSRSLEIRLRNEGLLERIRPR
jgi:hypothetical protein